MMKGDMMAKRSSFGTIVRKRLSDITNSHSQSKSPPSVEKTFVDSSYKEQIDNLVKENTALVKLLQDKNKVIALSTAELQRLRTNIQRMQLQNWNLAQANSLMIAELNFSKEKMKSLQHEISCKEALIKAKTNEVKEVYVIPDEETRLDKGKVKCHHFTRSKSLGHSTVSQQVVAKEAAAENKRRCLRRQSATPKIQHSEPNENLLEIEDMVLQTDFPMPVEEPAPPPSSPIMTEAKQEKNNDDNRSRNPVLNSRSSERTSMGRPSRKAAEKVQSYKEIPLNVKMRRKD
ncbi:OLC1v1003775C1 [Oldenlandia corymbosa var. corymbosa]|uniref:OLC1v1003775C1 n=1 Tax=Oldenlandia corymbosa var. corymbosa TaxID=529605 RepID=A0AAV1DD73_OLDCO|nr:OLC1v1003775C1 [Oldenlandia corymbosa var. corymbosa]